MSTLKLLRIIRLHIVAGGALAFSLGALLAIVKDGNFDITRVVLGYSVVLLGDLSTHYSNDYFDVEVDKHIKRKKVFAGSHILVNYPMLRPLARFIAIVFFVLSNVLATIVVLVFSAPPELLVVTYVANLLGWAYSAPPFRLIARGLGEVVVAFATGFAIPSIGYLTIRGHFDSLFISLSLPFMMYGFMLSLNLGAPDIVVDQKEGKRNLAVRIGERFCVFLNLALAFFAAIAFLGYAWHFPYAHINLNVVVLASFLPLTTGLLSVYLVCQKRDLHHFSTLNIAALFLFNIVMITYLLVCV